MDDFLMIRFALDNVHPRSLGEGARAAFERVLTGEAVGDADARDGRSYALLRDNRMAGQPRRATTGTHVASPGPLSLQVASGPTVPQDGSLDRASLFLKQKEAADSV